MYDEDDYLMLSGIQHFCFCRRQWALIHVEQQWEENYHTIVGELFHQRAHDETLIEKRGDVLITRALNISSSKLGLSGQCDVVEFHRNENGITLWNYDGTWNVVPIEYKKGKEKSELEDQLQLCAECMCLEEMYLTKIEYGYLYYGTDKNREKIMITDELKSMVEKNVIEMHQYYKKGYTPTVKKSKKCNSCSLRDICLPELEKCSDVKKYIMGTIKDMKNEENS